MLDFHYLKLLQSTVGSQAAASQSTRRHTLEVGRFTRDTPGSKSLERGLQLLRTFRPGVAMLTNSELAKRTGLPRPTISRLTHSLVDAGFLSYDLERRAYRLAAVFLTLAQAFRREVSVLSVALPLMRKVAEGEQINVGLAVPDQLEMVYLDSVRESRRGIFRRISAGSRIPMELTSLGRAYLAGLAQADRQVLLKRIAPQYGEGWPTVRREISRAIVDVARLGYCVAVWQPGMMALASFLKGPDRAVYAINISFPTDDTDSASSIKRYSHMLRGLVDEIEKKWIATLAESPP
jgi:DNA-binding IclR family transcriptional regulator